MAIEIVDFPFKSGGSFHSYVNVYQNVVHGRVLNCPPGVDLSCHHALRGAGGVDR